MMHKLIMLNSARNALRYIIRAYGINKIYIPYYTCPSVWQSIHKENCQIDFYHINNEFMPEKDFTKEDYILTTNYFGICDSNIAKLEKEYQNLVVDNSHACFSSHRGIASFCSLRKFFNVADGAILHTKRIVDNFLPEAQAYSKTKELILRNEFKNKETYNLFLDNEKRIEKEELSTISKDTKKRFLEENINEIKEIRLNNFNKLETYLSASNELNINLDKNSVPMCYPYLPKDRTQSQNIRKKLNKNNIFIEQYWGKMPATTQEFDFQSHLLPLPIHQKYTEKEMLLLIDIINS